MRFVFQAPHRSRAVIRVMVQLIAGSCPAFASPVTAGQNASHTLAPCIAPTCPAAFSVSLPTHAVQRTQLALQISLR
jgi:hypothetical protein